MFKYEVDRSAALPTGEPIDKLAYEAYPEDYHEPKEENKESSEKICVSKGKRTKITITFFCWS